MTTRQKRLAARYLLMSCAGLAAGILSSWVILTKTGHLPFAAVVLLIGVFCAGVLIAGAPYMAKLDDRQRSARQTSWYWGGLFGLMFGFFTANAVGMLHPDRWSDWSKSACLMAVVQLASYYIARLVWWRLNKVQSA